MRATSLLRPALVCALFLSAAAPSSVQATLVAIYSRPGEALPRSPDSLVQAFKLNPTGLESRFTFRISDSSILSPEFSVPPGVSAYFWSDRTFEPRGFLMQGVQATFLNALPALAAQALAAPEDTLAAKNLLTESVTGEKPGNLFRNHFQGITLEPDGLRLAYVLAQPGPVSLEAFSLDGRTLRRWNWNDAASGAIQHSVAWPDKPRGAYWIRWTPQDRQGDAQAVRWIAPADGGR